MTQPSPARVARDAIDYLHEHGWYQGDMNAFDGRVCSVGALAKSCGDIDIVNAKPLGDAYRCLTETINELWPEPYLRSIMGFNDDPTTTEDDIHTAFEKAAIKLEEEGR